MTAIEGRGQGTHTIILFTLPLPRPLPPLHIMFRLLRSIRLLHLLRVSPLCIRIPSPLFRALSLSLSHSLLVLVRQTMHRTPNCEVPANAIISGRPKRTRDAHEPASSCVALAASGATTPATRGAESGGRSHTCLRHGAPGQGELGMPDLTGEPTCTRHVVH